MKNEKSTQYLNKDSYGNNYNNSVYTAYGADSTHGANGVKANEKKGKKAPKAILPAGTPKSAGNVDRVSDPPVPNRAHTEM